MNNFIDTIAEKATSFHVDFRHKSAKVNKEYIIKNGEFIADIPEMKEDITDYLDALYDDYAHSVPSENSDKQRTRFRPLPYEELSDEDLMFGEPRERARLKLELAVLITMLRTKWEDVFGNGFFYQSENFHDFVIYKEWV